MSEAAESEIDVGVLEAAIGYSFRKPELLKVALTHASHANEHSGMESNERLEFLGDSVIGMTVAFLLYEAHPTWPEGDLTRGLHQLVDGRGLARLARRLDLGMHLRLGRTELRSGGREKDGILADAVEAVLGAMYIDGGVAPVEALSRREFALALDADAPRVERDPKTRFQEWVMSEYGAFPVYSVEIDSHVEGHEDRFEVDVRVGGEVWGTGLGRSKRDAEQRAAEAAYTRRERMGRGKQQGTGGG